MKMYQDENQIVKTNNDVNYMPMPPKLKGSQVDIFYAILSLIKDKHESKTTLERFFDPNKRQLVVSFAKIVKICRMGKNWNKDFLDIWHETREFLDILTSFKIEYSKGKRHYMFVCFEEAIHDEYEQVFKITFQKRFYDMIINYKLGFTCFELSELISLVSRYAKRLYPILKQYKQTGYVRLEWEEFKKVLDIPENYRQIDIDNRVLKPTIKELTHPRYLFDQERIPFENLSYEKIKGKGQGRGGNVIGIEFKFKKQTDFLTKDEQIKFLKAGYEELATEAFKNNMAQAENQELKERIEKLEKISYGIGLNAYCGLKYYSDKGETLRVLDLMDIPNSSDSNRYKAKILNEKTKETFFIHLESLKHLMNIISKNEADLIIHNQEIINRRIKSNT